MVPANFAADDGSGNLCRFTINAMIDSSSPISFIKSIFVPNALRSPLPVNYDRFSGTNDSPLNILNILKREFAIQGISLEMKFYIVPDETMHAIALLARDFAIRPEIKINIAEESVEILKTDVKQTDNGSSINNQLVSDRADCLFPIKKNYRKFWIIYKLEGL